MNEDQLIFENRNAFREWLIQNHQKNPGIWLVFSKDAGFKTLTANEALEEALCFGWIDGQIKSLDARMYIKRFTPRRKRSSWSERNRKLAAKLIAEGAMTDAGHAAIARARELGTWEKPVKPTSQKPLSLQVMGSLPVMPDKKFHNLFIIDFRVFRMHIVRSIWNINLLRIWQQLR